MTASKKLLKELLKAQKGLAEIYKTDPEAAKDLVEKWLTTTAKEMPELTPLWIKKTKIARAAAPPNLPKEDRDRLEKFLADLQKQVN